jgi:hypothetical protein
MPTHVFTIVLDRRPTASQLDALYEAGFDDAAFGQERGSPIAEFDRESSTMAEAIASAIRGLEAAGLTPLRIIDNDLVTLADIADRIHQSRESVRRYATGERGEGQFPPPLNPDRDGTAFYRWTEVAPWIRDNLHLDVPDSHPALVLANLVVQARRLVGQVEDVGALTGLLAA